MSRKPRVNTQPSQISEEERKRLLAQCYSLILSCSREVETKEATDEALAGDASVADALAPKSEQHGEEYHHE